MSARTQTGIGFDSHRFAKSGTLVLGGRRFSEFPALKGHSDGDALLHAVVDALLGAAVLGDIGRLFPDTDPTLKGLSSRIMIRKAISLLKQKGYMPVHIDITAILEAPRLGSFSGEIRKILSDLTGLPVTQISLKAKRPEGLNLFKAPGGVAVWAVATVEKRAR